MKKLWKPALLLAAVAVMVIGMLGSGAWFTDEASTTGTNAIQAGVLSIEDGALSTESLGTVKLAPGDKTGDMVVVIRNDGNLPLFWVGDLVITAPTMDTRSEFAMLKEAIYIDYALMQFEGGSWNEPDDNFIYNGIGSGPYPSEYNLVANLNKYKKVGLDVFDGHNFNGVAPYEFFGALKPGFDYRLTLRFGLVEAADNSFQGLGPLNISFNVQAMQPKAAAINAVNATWSGTDLESWALGQLNNQLP